MTTTIAPPLTPWEGFHFNHPGRVGPACLQIGELLADGRWHPWTGIVTPVAETNDLSPKTVDGLLRGMIRVGCVQRKGNYNSRFRKDHRMIRRAAESLAMTQTADQPTPQPEETK